MQFSKNILFLLFLLYFDKDYLLFPLALLVFISTAWIKFSGIKSYHVLFQTLIYLCSNIYPDLFGRFWESDF